MKNKGSLYSIQLLRAFAALGVVYCHYALYAFPGFATGAFGVDIFFVISGFIIAYVVSMTTGNFFLKRIIRVVPLYMFATSVTILAALIFPQWFYNTTITIGAIIKSLLFIPYKIGVSGPILIAGWTLNFEMIFYLTMALCILITKKKQFLTAMCAFTLVAFIIVLNIVRPNGYVFEFYRKGLFPEFIGGLALYHLYVNYAKHFIESPDAKKNKFRTIIIAMTAIGSLLFLIFTEMYAMAAFEYRNIQLGIPALIFVGAILLLEKTINENNRFVKLGMLVGDSSYAMYLFHPYFIYFLLRVIYPRIFGDANGILIESVKMLVALLVTVVGSIYVFKLIDNPMQKYLRRFVKSKSQEEKNLQRDGH